MELKSLHVFHSEINNEKMDVTNDSSSRGNVKKPKAKSKWKKREARHHNVTQEEEEMDERIESFM